MRKWTKNPRGITLLQRMGMGFIFHILVMVTASLTEMRRLGVAKDHGVMFRVPSIERLQIAASRKMNRDEKQRLKAEKEKLEQVKAMTSHPSFMPHLSPFQLHLLLKLKHTATS
ncbi:hypothetical protein IFM89_011237 [Coptis chinensis]|uniref:Uncharacterized protein n=1 Tax=Coptis chinensis TaxID=261450 RepID=A0A835LRC9_9MAGN|nr:hypothetical protein IFM89_011237 [Coptis chinensis]